MADSDSEDHSPSPYMANLFANVPKSRRAVTVNTTNPLNTATAYPSMHVGIDAKATPEQGKFPMKTYDRMDSASLVKSALKPGSVAERMAKKAAAQKDKASPKAFHLGVDAAPGRGTRLSEYELEDSPSEPGSKKAASARKKRKRKRDDGLGEEGVDDDAEEESPVARRKSKRASNLGLAKNQSVKATPKLLRNVEDVFRMDNAYYKLPDTPEQALEADRLLMKWKEEGRPWREIIAAWTKITGRKTDDTALSARHFRIQENYAHSTKKYDVQLLEAKKIAQKQSGGDLWDRVESILWKDHKSYLRAAACRRRFFRIQIEMKEAEAAERVEVEKDNEETGLQEDYVDAEDEEDYEEPEVEADYEEAKEEVPAATTELDTSYASIDEPGRATYYSITGEEYLKDVRALDGLETGDDPTDEDELY